MKPTFTLFTRINQKFLPILIKKDTPIVPANAGSYYVRYTENGKRVMRPLGKDITTAYVEVKNLEIAREFEKRGMPVPVRVQVVPTTEAKQSTLEQSIAKYTDEVRDNKARKTWQAYKNSLALFQKSCRAATAESVKREDMLAFKSYLRNTEKMSERSVYNNFLNVMVFLKWAGVTVGVKLDDWPKKMEREAEEYTDSEISALLNSADAEERLLLNCFLCTGMRSGEMAHLHYGKIDFPHNVWTVERKDGWETKTTESQRDIPVPEWLTKRIKERMERGHRTKNDLVFFNSDGGPNLHMLRIVKRVAKRAKLNDIRVDDHKFRSTAITRWLRDGATVPDVMRWVGHVNPQTILRYAAKVNVRNPEIHAKATRAFAQFNGMGD